MEGSVILPLVGTTQRIVIVGPELLKDMEDQMVKIKQNLKVAQDKKKICIDQNRIIRQFQDGDHVFLKVRSKKSSLNLGN